MALSVFDDEGSPPAPRALEAPVRTRKEAASILELAAIKLAN
jgi:hypothetical protein